MTAKRMILRRTQHNFQRACDQIVILNRRMEGVLQRYHEARIQTNKSFRYKLRLRLAIVEGVRNMFYEYANRKAYEIVSLRRDLFGEIVEVISNEAANDVIFAANGGEVDNDEEDDTSGESDLADSDSDSEMEIDVDLSP